MKILQLNNGVQPELPQSSCFLNSLLSFAFSVHHSSHHHEHPAQ